jgi:hypothetical protein
MRHLTAARPRLLALCAALLAALCLHPLAEAEDHPKQKRPKATPERRPKPKPDPTPGTPRARPPRTAAPALIGGLGLVVAGPLMLSEAEPDLSGTESQRLSLAATLGLPVLSLTGLAAPSHPSQGIGALDHLGGLVLFGGLALATTCVTFYLFEPPKGQGKFEVLGGLSVGALTGMVGGYLVGDLLHSVPAAKAVLMWGAGAFMSHLAYVAFFDGPSKQALGESKPLILASPLFVF